MSKRDKRLMLEARLMEGCGKFQYTSEEEANKHLREIRNSGKKSNNHKMPKRAYKCDDCPFWHLTSKP